MKRIVAMFTAVFMLFICLGVNAHSPADEAENSEALLEFNSALTDMIKAHSELTVKDGGAYSTARIIVGSSSALDYAGSLAHVYGCGRHVIQYSSPEAAMAAAERYRDMDGVEYAVPDAPVSVEWTQPFEPIRQEPHVDSFKSWGFGANFVNAFAYNEWLLESVGSVDELPEIIVAVIDTGLEYNHPFFAGRTVPGYDFGDNDSNTGGGYFHGTHVAGTVVDGTLLNVKVMGLKCTDDYGGGLTSVIVNCMQYAYQNGAAVANVSIGGYYPETYAAYNSVINQGSDAGTVYTIASGNDSMNVSYCYPACIERALTVAAHDQNNTMWSGSNYGNLVDITAPGVNISSAMPNGGFQAQTGTSMAAPHAAAACAMLKSGDPDMSADDVMDALKGAAVDHGINGGGTGCLSMTALIGGSSVTPGDVDSDGNVTVADALTSLRCAMGLLTLEGSAFTAADVDGSGTVNVADALMILRIAMGLA